MTHPFYQRWQKGKVPHEVLQEYARQYYHYERALPTLLRTAMEHMEEGPDKEAVARVLEDESSNPKPHADLWLDFAEGLGLDRDEVRSAEPTARTRNLVETYTTLANKGADEGLGAIYAYESQFAAVAAAKGDGLRSHYGVEDSKATSFFDLHADLDEHHARVMRSAFSDTARSQEAAGLALEAWWRMLDQFEQLSDKAA